MISTALVIFYFLHQFPDEVDAETFSLKIPFCAVEVPNFLLPVSEYVGGIILPLLQFLKTCRSRESRRRNVSTSSTLISQLLNRDLARGQPKQEHL